MFIAGVTLPTFLDSLFAEAPSDHQLHVARVAVHLCAQLADGMQDGWIFGWNNQPSG